MKLGLGTAQFGLDYGISNTRGRTPAAEVCAILDAAMSAGVTVLDTAPAYGASEEALGVARAAQRFRIVTKTPVYGGHPGADAPDELERSLLRSLDRFGAERIHGLLVHHASDALSDTGGPLIERARRLQEQGLVGKIGVSVYAGPEARAAVDRFGVDIVQLPVSVYDQRALMDGTLDYLKQAGVEVHARSVFLQGLLLMPCESLPASFERIRAHHAAYVARVAEMGITAARAALGFVIGLPQVDIALAGVEDVAQFQELAASAEPLAAAEFESFAVDDPAVVDPSRWVTT